MVAGWWRGGGERGGGPGQGRKGGGGLGIRGPTTYNSPAGRATGRNDGGGAAKEMGRRECERVRERCLLLPVCMCMSLLYISPVPPLILLPSSLSIRLSFSLSHA